MVSVTQVPGSQALKVQALARSPELAAHVANAYVSSLQESLDDLAKQQATRQREFAEHHLRSVQQTIKADKAALSSLRGAPEELERRTRELEVHRSLLLQLLKQREAALIAESKPSSEFLSVDEALPLNKVKRSKQILLIPVAAFVGLMLGVMLAFLKPRFSGWTSN